MLETNVAENKAVKNNGRPVLLSIENLRVWFELRRFGFGSAGFVRAVDDVNFNLYQGEAIAVVGESGCGKSSLMKTILGLYQPKGGKVTFDGRVIGDMGESGLDWYRAQVGYVQQDPYGALPPFMSLNQILNEPLLIGGVRSKAERQARIFEVLSEVKMHPPADFLPKFPHMLSGGQQQRAVMARAMIRRPKLIVADEPGSMLDARVRVEILKLLRGLQESHHLSFIYITHDLSTVKYFSERIFVMYAGKMVEKGPIGKILKNPLHPYTFALMAATSDPDANNADSFKEVPPGEPPSLVKPPAGCRFHPRCARCIQDLCNQQEPPEFEPEPNHQVQCWLYR